MKRGSALILVLIIVAAVVTVVFGTQRLALIQFAQSTAEEDNLYAYYAAKGGVEDGLLRFRYERDAETPEGMVHRVDVTAGEDITAGGTEREIPEGKITDNNPKYNPAHQYYDLKIEFKKSSIGSEALNTTGADAFLEREDTLELTGFSKEAVGHFLRFKVKFVKSQTDSSACTDTRAFVDVQQITETSSAANYSGNKGTYQVGGFYDSADANNNLEIKTPTSLTSFVRIRPFYCSIRYYLHTTSQPNSKSVSGIGFDGLKTYITSTGYYGKAKRTLVAEIDRRSGTLLHIYDFNAYAGRGSVR